MRLIRHHDGRTFLRDLETTNGTVLNGRAFHSQEIEVINGDLITVGPFLLTLAIDSCGEEDTPRLEVPAACPGCDCIEGRAPCASASRSANPGARADSVDLLGVHA